MSWTLTWEEAFAAGPSHAGGKGWNLGRLHRYGFVVPRGGLVTAAAYRAHLTHNGLHELLQEVAGAVDTLDPAVAARLDGIRAAILSAPLPPEVDHAVRRLLGALQGPVAVRSSATAEDSAEASFAGVHRSYLNVAGPEAVIDALKGCYASLWTPQAIAYRRRLDLSDDEVSAACVILEMVEAKSAGVAFSCDPVTGRLNAHVISANPGLGESVVGGESEPDEYETDPTVYPATLVKVRIGRKQKMTRPREGGGTELVQTPEPGARVLTDEQIRELSSVIGRVQDALGALTEPQDIEWAHDGHRFVLLQSRPVTRLPEFRLPGTEPFPTIWSNANLREVLPGVQSPLNWTLMRYQIDILMLTPFNQARYPVPSGVRWIRLFAGKSYFNLTALQWGYYDAIGLLPEETNRILGGHQPVIDVPPHPFRSAAGPARVMRSIRTLAASWKALRQTPAAFAEAERWCREAEQTDFTRYSDEALVAFFLAVRHRSEWFLPIFQSLNGTAGGTLQYLWRVLKPVFGQRANALSNSLLTGRSQVTSAEQGTRLIALGNQALRDEAVAAWFGAPDWAPGQWRTALGATGWAAQFEAYLADYGHRGVYELELANPRWRDDPSYLLEAVRSQVLAGREITLEDQEVKRRAAEAEVYGRIGRWTPRGLLVRSLSEQAARAVEGREMGKSLTVRIMSASRLAIMEAARRLVARGVLEQEDDIFFLCASDLEAVMAGRPVGPLGALIADRRAQHARWEAEETPDVIEGDAPVARAAAPALTGAVMQGMGVSSGRASGPARIVRHPREGVRLQQGDVLVAPSTDPAWTPLFLRASALVMEVGGHLSHGSIVAREYGIPAVVNVQGALAAWADGERLTVDGDRGEVARSADRPD